MSELSTKPPCVIREERRRTPRECGLIELAPLWPKTGENLGTLCRTADAVGACVVVPEGSNASKAIRRGNTIGVHNSPVHWVSGDVIEWLSEQSARVVAVELAYGATSISDAAPVIQPTVVLLGHEVGGIPKEAWQFVDEAIEIPMLGVGNSLNVAVAASLVAYKLAGLL